jgi:hypothetical protein
MVSPELAPFEIDRVVFDFPDRARRAEGILPTKDFPKGPPAIFRPSQHKLMGPFPSAFFEDEMNASEWLRLIEEQIYPAHPLCRLSPPRETSSMGAWGRISSRQI